MLSLAGRNSGWPHNMGESHDRYQSGRSDGDCALQASMAYIVTYSTQDEERHQLD
jgi:hypothetical protein